MKVGEEGLVPRTGAEFMALETTAEAGTCLAWRSMLGLVGSSARAEGAVGEGTRRLNLSAPWPLPPIQAGTTSPRLQKPSRALLATCPLPRELTHHGSPPTVVTEAQPLPPPSR